MSVNASAGGRSRNHIVLTSHGAPTGVAADGPTLNWGAPSAAERGPVVATLTDPKRRNAIGSHAGSYAIYRALAIAAGALPADFRADLTNTAPSDTIGPHPQWGDAGKIVSLDPYGHMIGEAFPEAIAGGLDVRPSIAITRARIDMPEIRDALRAGRLAVDGDIIGPKGDVRVTKAAIEPVWYLPGIAERFGVTEGALRRALFEHTGGMFPELVTRGDLKVFLPPIGGMTLYMFGEPSRIGDGITPLACRVHDECNGSDVFSSDICTCRPYLAHGIELCVEMAQKGGVGLVVYNRKEGRALGEVTKFLVYNARKRQEGGDLPETYFKRTECVAGVQDMRFQELMPDVFHWLGIRQIDRFASMSDMKFNALDRAGIRILERVPIPDDLIPQDARVEMEAKVSAGYYNVGFQSQYDVTQGRGLEE
ncbi:GTP cyclohydrolase II [Ancylobacter amanitiformis]|uniref:GTP cyclohydrolase II n=1 Tax=Ancylobacter amanitiformis TaxID=217069 RepID=A0ABU0LV80_9HYPH|nr:GTP cyclohydrolase II [Ancylobacter amanitiformis]MDQ0512596.1 GTP cyclohydrolase II [Ancylobacter amanitiformis]